MFSSEMWYNPDLPLGTTLWTSNGKNMEEYITKCNQDEDQLAAEEGREPEYGAYECTVGFSEFTSRGVSMKDGTLNEDYVYQSDNFGSKDEKGLDFGSDSDDEKEHYYDRAPPRNTRREPPPRGVVPMDEDEDFSFFAPPDQQYLPEDEQPNFLIPKALKPGQLAPLYFRDTKQRLRDEEAFVIGLPPKLLQEFNKYMENNGMLNTAKKIAYEIERGDKEHELYTLDDGRTWGIMHPTWEGNDMVWIDPGDEVCFESLIDVLRKGDFDIVLEAIGDYFELDGLMVQGIGPIFISYFEHDPEYQQIHFDLPEAQGSFYNVIVPLYIPEDGASLYVGDDERGMKTIQMKYNIGVFQGAGTRHGTGECDYREKKDVRLSVAIYVADVNPFNVDVVASESTALWPTQGDVRWFMAQRGRLWKHDDPSRSLKNDKGRQPIRVKDKRSDCQEQEKELCVSDPAGFRLECPKTCKVYLADDEYYTQLGAMVNNKSQPAVQTTVNEPICTEPTCSEQATADIVRFT